MEGDDTAFRWARIDAKVKTNMPDADFGVSTVQSKTHGNVLWLKLDKDATRVGYVLSPALQEKYKDSMTQEQAVEEAINAMKPFTLEVERVDWWTQYRYVASSLLLSVYGNLISMQLTACEQHQAEGRHHSPKGRIRSSCRRLRPHALVRFWAGYERCHSRCDQPDLEISRHY